MDICVSDYEKRVKLVGGYIDEHKRWERGEGGTLRSMSMEFDEAKAIERESRKDHPKMPPTIAASAERTDRALKKLAEQSEQQKRCLVLYHTYTTCDARISRIVGCKRQRVPQLVRWAHDNFIAIREFL